MGDTLVFIPAWNEGDNLPGVLDELRRELPDADVLVVDDGSTDRTAEVAREHGAEVLSFGENRGLQAGIAAGYGWAWARYAYCGRVDADGQHPAAELRRLLELVRRGRGRRRRRLALRQRPRLRAGRYEPEDPPARYRAAAALDARRPRPPFNDATSGLYAASAKALPALSLPTRAARPRWRPSCVCTTRGFTSRRCRSTCASARAASRS